MNSLPTVFAVLTSFMLYSGLWDTLDEVRQESWRETYAQVKELTKANPSKPGRPKEDNPAAQGIRQAAEKADKIKNLSYALGKAPEHLTEKQKIRVEMISKLISVCIAPTSSRNHCGFF